MSNKADYVELGLSCADICRALERGMDGKKLSDLNKSVCDAVNHLTTWVIPAIQPHRVLPLTMLPIAGLLRRYKRRSPNEAVGIESLSFFTRRMTRI